MPATRCSWEDSTSWLRTGMPEPALSIGEVINLLRDDFPDVSVSKIRFLESQGLIDPNRSASGYRQFNSDDVARLRFILQQQRDHFLPLKVIKSKLTLWERGEEASVAAESSSHLEESGEPLDWASLLKRSGLDEEELKELIEVGVVRPLSGTTVFPTEAGVVASEAKRLMEYGLEPRHLRSIRLSVDRESDLLGQLVAPLARATNAESRGRARDVLEACSDSVSAMHRALLSVELRQHLST